MRPLSGMIASKVRRGTATASALLASTLVLPAAAAPGFVERSLDMVHTMPPIARYVLVVSVLMLVVSVTLKIIEARRNATPRFGGRDLRWWLNPEWRAGVYR